MQVRITRLSYFLQLYRCESESFAHSNLELYWDSEFSNDLHVLIMLLKKRGVARSFKCDPFNILNVVEKWLHDEILSNVLAPINDESWWADKMKMISDRPILQNAVWTPVMVKPSNTFNTMTYGAAATVGSPSRLKTCSIVYESSSGTGTMIHPCLAWNFCSVGPNFSGSFIAPATPCCTSSGNACSSCALDLFQRLDAARELVTMRCLRPGGCLRTLNSLAKIPP